MVPVIAPLNIAMTFGKEKLEWCGYSVVKIFEDVFIRLEFMNVTWQLDRQTDGQTDGRTDKPWWHRPRLHSIMRQLYTIVVLILKSIFFCYVVNVWNSLSANVTEFEFLSHFQWSLHKIDFGAFLFVKLLFLVLFLQMLYKELLMRAAANAVVSLVVRLLLLLLLYNLSHVI